ncbi:hypothetical protein N9Y17_01385 [Gammaproteobacteria bacterium]|nr:hypothetical protein [Gammaproteobacteria bacterium]
MKCQQSYLYVDQNSQLQIWFPLSNGVFVGTDNTCETTKCLKDFFGETFNQDGQAIISLTSFIAELNQLDSDQINQVVKNDLIAQADKWINFIRDLKENSDFQYFYRELIGVKPFDDRMTSLIQSTGNIKTVRLSVPYDKEQDDPYTKLEKTDFTLPHRWVAFGDDHDRKIDPESDVFGNELRSVTDLLSPEHDVTRMSDIMKEKGYADVSLDQIDTEAFREAFKQAAEEVTGFKIEGWLNFDGEIDSDYCRVKLGFAENESIQEVVESFYASFKSKLVINDGQRLQGYRYGFKGIGVSIAVQLYIAHLSFYSQYLGHGQENLGVKLEQNQALRTRVIDALKNNLHGDLRRVLFDCLKDHLSLEEADFEQVNQWYQSNISVVMQQESWHPDEYMLVNPNQQGRAFVYRNQIVVNFYDFLDAYYRDDYAWDLSQIHNETKDNSVILEHDQIMDGLKQSPLSIEENFNGYMSGMTRCLLAQDTRSVSMDGGSFDSQWKKYLEGNDLNNLFQHLAKAPAELDRKYILYCDIADHIGCQRYMEIVETMDTSLRTDFYDAILLNESFDMKDFSIEQIIDLTEHASCHDVIWDHIFSESEKAVDSESMVYRLAAYLTNPDAINGLIGRLNIYFNKEQKTHILDMISWNSNFSLAKLAHLNCSFMVKHQILEQKYNHMGSDQYFSALTSVPEQSRKDLNSLLLSGSQFNLGDLKIDQIIALVESDVPSQNRLASQMESGVTSQGQPIWLAVLDSPDVTPAVIRCIMHWLCSFYDPLSPLQLDIIYQIAVRPQCIACLSDNDLERYKALASHHKDAAYIFKILNDKHVILYFCKILENSQTFVHFSYVVYMSDELFDQNNNLGLQQCDLFFELIFNHPCLLQLTDTDQLKKVIRLAQLSTNDADNQQRLSALLQLPAVQQNPALQSIIDEKINIHVNVVSGQARTVEESQPQASLSELFFKILLIGLVASGLVLSVVGLAIPVVGWMLPVGLPIAIVSISLCLMSYFDTANQSHDSLEIDVDYQPVSVNSSAIEPGQNQMDHTIYHQPGAQLDDAQLEYHQFSNI